MPQLPEPRNTSTPLTRDDTPAVVKKVRGEPLSIRNHEVDPKRVYEQMFGRKPEVDERTGAIYHNKVKGLGSGGV